jgi:hypothetical protein
MSFSRSKVKGQGHDGVNLEKLKSGQILLIQPQILPKIVTVVTYISKGTKYAIKV